MGIVAAPPPKPLHKRPAGPPPLVRPSANVRAPDPVAERARLSSRPPMAARDKQQLTHQALGLLREQLEAQVVLYKSELRTSPELDGITAQVVNQLRQFQQAAFATTTTETPDQIEQRLT